MKIKCAKSICETDQKPGMMQAFYAKDGTLKSARIRHYIGMEAGMPKFTYCTQTLTYAESQLKLVQKPFNESVASKAIATAENHKPDQHGQMDGQAESGANKQTKCGCSLAWFDNFWRWS
jgi:hypothetical protein